MGNLDPFIYHIICPVDQLFNSILSDKPSLVRLGGQKVITSEERNVFREDVPIAQVIVHPEYKRAFYYNDIGLLRLARRVK